MGVGELESGFAEVDLGSGDHDDEVLEVFEGDVVFVGEIEGGVDAFAGVVDVGLAETEVEVFEVVGEWECGGALGDGVGALVEDDVGSWCEAVVGFVAWVGESVAEAEGGESCVPHGLVELVAADEVVESVVGFVGGDEECFADFVVEGDGSVGDVGVVAGADDAIGFSGVEDEGCVGGDVESGLFGYLLDFE